MASRTDLSNQALGHLGASLQISNVDTDETAEARICRTFIEMAIKTTLRAAQWPGHRRVVALGLIEENPSSEWAYSYQYPADCLFSQRILNGVFRRDSNFTKVSYEIYADPMLGKLIYTNQQDAQLQYTSSAMPLDFWDEDLVLACSLMLASLIAPKITNGDPFKLGDRALSLYGGMVSTAQANAFNEEQESRSYTTDLVGTRGGY